jgi:DNA replication protein DnaC
MCAAPATTNEEPTMMMNTTLAQLRTLKLDGLAAGLEDQLTQPGMAALSFEERMALLVDREVHARNDRKLLRLLKNAHLKYGQAAIEDIDNRPGRGIDRREVMSLALGDWVSAGHSILITGPTGAGKSWLGCALAQYTSVYPIYRKNCVSVTAAGPSANGSSSWPGPMSSFSTIGGWAPSTA